MGSNSSSPAPARPRGGPPWSSASDLGAFSCALALVTDRSGSSLAAEFMVECSHRATGTTHHRLPVPTRITRGVVRVGSSCLRLGALFGAVGTALLRSRAVLCEFRLA